MPPKKHGTIWPASPHTIAKIAILEDYLKQWFPVMGQKMRTPLVYIDGFAGPGHYTNYPKGSPIAALVAAQGARAACKSKWVAGETHCVFIESDTAIFSHLVQHIAPFQGQKGLHIYPFNDSFENGLAAFWKTLPGALTGTWPRFAFIDPFGATQAPFTVVRQLLASPYSEVLVNLDADGIGRILKAGDRANHTAVLTSIFGDASWQAALTAQDDFRVLCHQVLTLYTSKLVSIPKVEFVWPFEMAKKSTSIDYFLVFATQTPDGMRKMKQSMRRIGQGRQYRFCDAHADQVGIDLHSEADLAKACEAMHAQYAGRTATYDELDRFALKSTNYFDPKRMGITLEREGRVAVTPKPGTKRRKGSFMKENIQRVTFTT